MKSVKRYAVVIILLMSSLILSSAIPVNYTGSNNLSNTIDNSLNQIQPPSNVIDNNSTDNSTAGPAADSDYGKLRDGSAYYYTDVNKITEYRNGTIDSDVSFNTVSASAEHGSASNPYVISTVAQWNAFAADTANATNANKVFVLGADIDFSGQEFKPVPTLGAKFYGCNYTLKNITHDFNNVANSGIFCSASENAVITDLSNDNFNFKKISGTAGGIVGYSIASVLNCHSRGRISGSVMAKGGGTSGIVGRMTLNTKTVYVYRCSTLVNLTIDSSSAGPVASIIGRTGEGAGVHLLDCFSISNNSFTGSDSVWYGGVLTYDYLGADKNGATAYNHRVENAVSYTNIVSNETRRHSQGSLFNGWSDLNTYLKTDIKNTYTAGKVSVRGAAA